MADKTNLQIDADNYVYTPSDIITFGTRYTSELSEGSSGTHYGIKQKYLGIPAGSGTTTVWTITLNKGSNYAYNSIWLNIVIGVGGTNGTKNQSSYDMELYWRPGTDPLASPAVVSAASDGPDAGELTHTITNNVITINNTQNSGVDMDGTTIITWRLFSQYSNYSITIS